MSRCIAWTTNAMKAAETVILIVNLLKLMVRFIGFLLSREGVVAKPFVTLSV